MDKYLPIISADYSGFDTVLDEYASQDKANKMLMYAIDKSINSISIDKAIEGLIQQRKKAKDFYSKSKK